MKIGLIDVDDENVKDVQGYGGKYKVTTDGRVISMYRYSNIHGELRMVGDPMFLKLSHDKKGYVVVNLYDGNGGRPWSAKVHRLVARAFLPNPENKRCVCHKDNNPQNNHVDNLYWGTDQENQDQAWKDGLHKSETPVIQIRKDNHTVVAFYKSECEAGRVTGISHQNISKCINGNRKSAGGYEWQKLA